jgi:ribA/ribD-fused uncharacterized protein
MTIDKFRGRHAFLSNFHPAEVELGGYMYPSVEHAFQAAKCAYREDRIEICAAEEPRDAKRLGRQVEARSDWNKVRVTVMASLVLQKFARHPELRRRLLETDAEELVEGNTWNDRFWGRVAGEGENTLGRILMQVRERLR